MLILKLFARQLQYNRIYQVTTIGLFVFIIVLLRNKPKHGACRQQWRPTTVYMAYSEPYNQLTGIIKIFPCTTKWISNGANKFEGTERNWLGVPPSGGWAKLWAGGESVGITAPRLTAVRLAGSVGPGNYTNPTALWNGRCSRISVQMSSIRTGAVRRLYLSDALFGERHFQTRRYPPVLKCKQNGGSIYSCISCRSHRSSSFQSEAPLPLGHRCDDLTSSLSSCLFRISRLNIHLQ